MIFDSWYDSYQGVIVLFRVQEGSIRPGSQVRFMATKAEYDVTKLGVFSPDVKDVKELRAGEVGFLSAAIKDINDVLVGYFFRFFQSLTFDDFSQGGRRSNGAGATESLEFYIFNFAVFIKFKG